MKKFDQMRKLMEEISDMHIKEAADVLSGEEQVSEQETGMRGRRSWLWAGLAAAGVVALLGAATVQLSKNVSQLQTGNQGMAESGELQDMTSEEDAAEAFLTDGGDAAVKDGETLPADKHIYTSDEVENAVIIRDHLDMEGKEAQIWYADKDDGVYCGMQSEGTGIWYYFQVKDPIDGEMYKMWPYLYLIKNIDGILYDMEFWGIYEDDGKAYMVVTVTNKSGGEAAENDITGSKEIYFSYELSDSGTLSIKGVSAEELCEFLKPVYGFADGADLVFVRGPEGICPAEEQPDLSDGYAKFSLIFPMVSEKYYDEFLGQYKTLQEQLSALTMR